MMPFLGVAPEVLTKTSKIISSLQSYIGWEDCNFPLNSPCWMRAVNEYDKGTLNVKSHITLLLVGNAFYNALIELFITPSPVLLK